MLTDNVAALQQKIFIKVILSVKVDVKSSRRDTGKTCDVIDGSVVIAFFIKYLSCGAENIVQGGAAAFRARFVDKRFQNSTPKN